MPIEEFPCRDIPDSSKLKDLGCLTTQRVDPGRVLLLAAHLGLTAALMCARIGARTSTGGMSSR